MIAKLDNSNAKCLADCETQTCATADELSQKIRLSGDDDDLCQRCRECPADYKCTGGGASPTGVYADGGQCDVNQPDCNCNIFPWDSYEDSLCETACNAAMMPIYLICLFCCCVLGLCAAIAVVCMMQGKKNGQQAKPQQMQAQAYPQQMQAQAHPQQMSCHGVYAGQGPYQGVNIVPGGQTQMSSYPTTNALGPQYYQKQPGSGGSQRGQLGSQRGGGGNVYGKGRGKR